MERTHRAKPKRHLVATEESIPYFPVELASGELGQQLPSMADQEVDYRAKCQRILTINHAWKERCDGLRSSSLFISSGGWFFSLM